MKKKLVLIELAEQLQNFKQHYNLHAIDIAFLTKTNEDNIIGVLEGSKNIGLQRAELIANIFGLRYYEFGNPNCSFPKYKELPDKTKQRISFREKEGVPLKTTYNALELNKHILNALKQKKVGDKFTSSMIYKLMPKKIQNLITSQRITERFDSFSIYVEKTNEKYQEEGKAGRKENYYKLIKEI